MKLSREDSSNDAESESKPIPMESNNIAMYDSGFATLTNEHGITESKIFQQNKIKIEAEALVPNSIVLLYYLEI